MLRAVGLSKRRVLIEEYQSDSESMSGEVFPFRGSWHDEMRKDTDLVVTHFYVSTQRRKKMLMGIAMGMKTLSSRSLQALLYFKCDSVAC